MPQPQQRQRPERRHSDRRQAPQLPKEEPEFKEKLIYVNRVAKVVKGGRRFSFSALVVLGNAKGTVGLGFGKANEVSEAIRKGIQDARHKMFVVPMKGTTIPYPIIAEEGAAKVMLKPATPGTGIIAGGAVRAIVERAGIKDILTKNLGTKNQINTARATIKGLKSLRSPDHFAAIRAFAANEPDIAEDEAEPEADKRAKSRPPAEKRKKKKPGDRDRDRDRDRRRPGQGRPGEQRTEAPAAPVEGGAAEAPAAVQAPVETPAPAAEVSQPESADRSEA